jgi:hypothetical protein
MVGKVLLKEAFDVAANPGERGGDAGLCNRDLRALRDIRRCYRIGERVL